MRQNARRPAYADQGFTLVEVLVAIALFAVLGALIASTLITSLRASSVLTSRAFAESRLLDVTNRLARDVAGAASVAVDANALTVVAEATGPAACTVARWATVGGVITRTTWTVQGTTVAGECNRAKAVPAVDARVHANTFTGDHANIAFSLDTNLPGLVHWTLTAHPAGTGRLTLTSAMGTRP